MKKKDESFRLRASAILTVALLWSMSTLALALDFSWQQPFIWTKQFANLPDSISLYAGTARSANGLPIRAWYVDVDYSDRALQIRPFLSTAPRGKQPVSEMARGLNAYVAVNGGYFDMTSVPARTFSLVQREGQILAPNIARITRPSGSYSVGRSAFGIRTERTFDIAWILRQGDVMRRLTDPLPNTPAQPAPTLTDEQANALPAWDAFDGIGGGPTLLKNGEVRVTYDEEVFFGSGFRADVPYPRTAVGYTANGHLLLFTVDGSRPDYSIGLTLDEVAQELKNLGCTDAMNLDGGGSTALAVNGRLINSPSGNAVERNVTSVLAIVPAVVAAPSVPGTASAPVVPVAPATRAVQ